MADVIVATFVQPLSRSEQAELFDVMPQGAVTVRPVELAPGDLGEPGSALVVIALTMTTITALCAWLSTRSKNVKMGLKISALGAAAEFNLEVTGADTPAQIRERVRAKGINMAS
jgi:hypothetical protein